MHAKGTPAALREYGEIATSLGCFDDAEGIFLVRDRKVDGVIACDLEEDASVRPALVGLAGGVQEARAKSEHGGKFLFVAHSVADGLQSGLVLGVHGDVAEESEIVALACAGEMRFQYLGEGLSVLESIGVFRVGVELDAVSLEERLFGGQLACGFVFAGELGG